MEKCHYQPEQRETLEDGERFMGLTAAREAAKTKWKELGESREKLSELREVQRDCWEHICAYKIDHSSN